MLGTFITNIKDDITDTQWAAVIIQLSRMMTPPQVWYQPNRPRR